jgi:signal transduction histidine kinase
MSQETLDKLFKIEHSFSSRGTENESGSGIGLILCKEFAEANGGTLSVKSKEKKWTEFIFTLPLSIN